MYKNKIIAVVIPAHNEALLIQKTLAAVPDYIDFIAVIDDASTDTTWLKIEESAKKDSRIKTLKHEKNSGAGASVATGFEWCINQKIDIVACMDGDGQMAPADLPALLDPVVEGRADFSKGNRLITGDAYRIMPKIRYFGNSILSLLTKVASGYWHIADSQSGYTAINKKALHLIDWDKMYKRYGQPNDLLVRLNIYNLKVRDVQINPVYGVGEKSGIKLRKII